MVKNLPANAEDLFYSQAAQATQAWAAWEKRKVFIVFPCVLSGLFLNPQLAVITKSFFKRDF